MGIVGGIYKLQEKFDSKHDKRCYISFSLHFLYCLNIYYAKLSARSILLNMPNDVVKVMITVCDENFLS